MTDQSYPITPSLEPQTAIGPEWRPCVKLPITVHVREQRPGETHSSIREGITPLRSDDLIMRGVQGEEYPIGRDLFNQTYCMGEAPPPEPPTDKELKEWYHQWAKSTSWWGHGDRPVYFARAVLKRWCK